ncbi:MAG: hypothetical protein COB42_04560 [Sulfurimonas sp.]|nr:MAG: hypothetical protein COB42_04560 [Sulfurimonas sp.]
MQRKNYLLKTSHRSGVAMIMAVTVIVIVATIMALGLRLSTQTTKRTVDLYVYEQAILLSKSAAEYALLRISEDLSAVNRCGHTNLNFRPPAPLNFYLINIDILYIYNGIPQGCNGVGVDMYAEVATPEQDGSVLMDITVSVNDPTITSEPIRYFRRSIQKL